jgi:hypothetical protein
LTNNLRALTILKDERTIRQNERLSANKVGMRPSWPLFPRCGWVKAAFRWICNGWDGGYTPALQFLAVQIELILGAWLILGLWRTTAWLAACVLLTTLATLSFLSVLRGQSDCGCFGSLKVHPGWTTVLNLGMLGLLLRFRPQVKWTQNFGSIGVAAVLALAAAGLAIVANGPLGDRLLARWQGRTIYFASSIVQAGEEPVGTKKRLAATVTNASSQDIRLIGGSVSCSCTTTQNLPVTVPAESSLEVEIELQFRGSPGQFEHRFEFFTSDKKQPKLVGVIVGRVADPSPP